MKMYCEACTDGVDVMEDQEAAFKKAGWSDKQVQPKPVPKKRGRPFKDSSIQDPNISDVGD